LKKDDLAQQEAALTKCEGE
jgi:hypothetical protein